MSGQRLDLSGNLVGRAPVSGLEIVFLSQLGPAAFVTPPIGQPPGPEETCFANCADRFALTGVAATVAAGVCSVLAATPATIAALPPAAALAFWLCAASATGAALALVINCAAQCGLFRRAPADAPPGAFETDLVRELGRFDPARREQIRIYLMREFQRDPGGVMQVLGLAGVRLPALNQALNLNLGGMQMARRVDDDDDDDDDDDEDNDDDNGDDDDDNNGDGGSFAFRTNPNPTGTAQQAQVAQLMQTANALSQIAAARSIPLSPAQALQLLMQRQTGNLQMGQVAQLTQMANAISLAAAARGIRLTPAQALQLVSLQALRSVRSFGTL